MHGFEGSRPRGGGTGPPGACEGHVRSGEEIGCGLEGRGTILRPPGREGLSGLSNTVTSNVWRGSHPPPPRSSLPSEAPSPKLTGSRGWGLQGHGSPTWGIGSRGVRSPRPVRTHLTSGSRSTSSEGIHRERPCPVPPRPPRPSRQDGTGSTGPDGRGGTRLGTVLDPNLPPQRCTYVQGPYLLPPQTGVGGTTGL